MAKANLKPRKQTARIHFGICEIELNGKKFSGFDYTRVEYDDGTVEETGLPAGMKPKPTLEQLMAKVLEKVK